MTDYVVALDVYEGPLDVLLRLIEREELDITLVSLALVTDQFLAHIAQLSGLPAEELADFIVIAARLIVIKSRVLLPRPAEVQGEEADEEEGWGEILVERLREYKRFKAVALKLAEMESQGLRSFPRVAPPPQIERRPQFGEAAAEELIRALRRVLETELPRHEVDGVVAPIVVHIADRMRHILTRVRQHKRVRFDALIRDARSRIEVIVTFLAMLELIKQQRVRVTQAQVLGAIYIESRAPEPEATPESESGAIGS